ncbi:DUF6897 domain-containing protein [Terrisporobacter muris]|uniref:Uncharacterized protein n=1 Tax=Terrisporobacter muris TaxID=2963284 RepID=A0A9X2S2Q1_9FIRM|nr:hypothetical protein [Terrisporobacter muris]MCR1824129.1 hypothetical protein [Terrisporobacter muris]
MSKLFLDLVGQECKIIFLGGLAEVKGIILDIDDNWVKLKLRKKDKVRLIKLRFVSSILLKENT